MRRFLPLLIAAALVAPLAATATPRGDAPTLITVKSDRATLPDRASTILAGILAEGD
ncbi:hypothetical protein [uncultured Jannaschia sp.]|uniref:hypothetical protein n=1 Tax=Jannaschia halovivens TaxID=3388667 RepID=UPI0026308F85|nr:hypothetical protein [uncultured Jannaschia sp.]